MGGTAPDGERAGVLEPADLSPPDALRRAALAAPADRVGPVCATEIARRLGADLVELWLIDPAGRTLQLVGTSCEEEAGPRPCREGDLRPGVVHRTGGRADVALAARGVVHGMLSVHGADGVADDLLVDLAGQTVLLLVQAARITDVVELGRRTTSFSVSAEFGWQLLPPTSVTTDRIDLSAAIEPAPRVSGDLFDWSIDGDRVWLAVVDARGRSLSAALPAALTVTSLRHARRAGLSLAEQVSLADQVVYDHWRGDAEVAATVLAIDLAGDRAEVVRAGEEPPAVHLRRGGPGGRVWEPALPVHEALGCYERSRYRAEPVDVSAGDAVLVVSAGGPGASDAAGRAFGTTATAAVFAAAAGLTGLPRALLDAWREHGGGELGRDATAVVLERRR